MGKDSALEKLRKLSFRLKIWKAINQVNLEDAGLFDPTSEYVSVLYANMITIDGLLVKNSYFTLAFRPKGGRVGGILHVIQAELGYPRVMVISNSVFEPGNMLKAFMAKKVVGKTYVLLIERTLLPIFPLRETFWEKNT